MTATKEHAETTATHTTSDLKAQLSRSRLTGAGQRYALLVLFAGVILFFSLYPQTADIFPTKVNAVTIIGNQAVLCLIAMSFVVSATSGVFDLSLAGTTGVASVATATVMSRFDGPVWLAVAAGLGCGAGFGAINAFLITKFRLDPIITTLGMSILQGGLMQWYTGAQTIATGISPSLTRFGSMNWFGVPRLLVVLVPAVFAMWYVMEHTPFGRRLSAIGVNPQAAKLVGIEVDKTIRRGLMLSGTLAGGAGVLLCARAGAVDSTTGPSFLFPAMAAVLLGATAIRPGRPNILGAIVGVFFVACAVSGLTIAGAGAWAPAVFNGAVLLAALIAMSLFAARGTRT